MALVKFIADKDCHLFIDMEEVEVVLATKMTKITLEAGSYLIEAKDAGGNTFKKYELMINPTDTQILQNLTDDNDDIEGTLEKLRNDSTVRFYHQRAAFVHDGHYGYINSQYKIVILPNYSYADEFINDYALVRRVFPDGEKATIIDTEGIICLEQWYDYIGSSNEQVLLKKDNIYYVFDKSNCSVVKKYRDAGYNNKTELIPVSQEIGIDDYYGFIDKTGKEIVPFIYDFVWNFEKSGFAKVKRFGHIYAVDDNANLYSCLEEAIKIKTGSTSEGENTKEVYNSRVLSKEESIIKGFDLDIQLYPIKEGNEWGLGGYGLEDVVTNERGEYIKYREVPDNKITWHRCDRILYYDNKYQIYRKDGICTLETDDKKYIFDADEIILNIRHEHTFEGYYDTWEINNVIIKKNRKYGIVKLNGGIILPIEYDLIETTNAIYKNTTGDVGIIWKNNKCSFVWMEDGEIFDSFKYEDIIVNEANFELFTINASTFLVKENGKYGCVDLDNNLILPAEYNLIDYKFESDGYGYFYKMTLHKNGKIGAYEYRFFVPPIIDSSSQVLEFLIEPDYDECVFFEIEQFYNSFIAVRKGGIWGFAEGPTPKTNDVLAWETHVKWSLTTDDVEFGFNSLEELKEEVCRRYN